MPPRKKIRSAGGLSPKPNPSPGVRVAAAPPLGRASRPVPPASRGSRPPVDAPAALVSSPRTRQVDVLAWAVVVFVTLATRLLNLDGAPLQPSEGALALTSWRMLNRTGFDLGASPLLTDGNTLLFLLFGASDAVSRVIPDVAGVFVALSPLFMRRHLGRVGSIASAAVLAVSPTLILASRTLDPTMPALALGIGGVVAGRGYATTHQVRYLGLAAGLGALLVMAGPLAYDVLIVLGAFAVAWRWEHGPETSPELSGSLGFAPDVLPRPPSRGEGAGREARMAWRAALIGFGATAILVWTGFLTNFEGLGGAVAIPLGLWAQSFSGFSAASLGVFPLIFVAYEPFALVAGAAGAALAARQNRPFDSLLIWWAIVGFGLLIASDGQQPLWAGLVVVPLGLLSATAAEWLASALQSSEQRWRFAAFAPLSLSLLATLLIAAGNASTPDPSVPRVLAFAPVLALVAFTVLFALYFDPRSAVVSASAVIAIALAGFSIHAALLLSPGGAMDPDPVFSPIVTSPDVRALSSDVGLILDQLRIARTIEGRPVTEQVEIATPYADPLRWYLRDARSLGVRSGIDGSAAIVIVASDQPAPGSDYAGEEFQIARTAAPPTLDPVALWRWLIYRQAGESSATWVKVYVKTQLAKS